MNAPPTLLIDGNSPLVRAVEATKNTSMTGPDGTSTAALVVFARTISRVIREVVPFRVVVCWDGGHARRTALHPEYKANRAHGSTYRLQSRKLAEEFLNLAGIPQVRIAGEEADDLVAAYWSTLDTPIVIFSSDKDLLQLVGTTPAGHPCSQLRQTNTGLAWYGRSDVEATHGCSPEHLPLAMALAGDSSDNIDGVPRFGLKTAVKHLAAAGWDLDAVDHPLVDAHRDRVTRNLALVDLRTPVGIELPTIQPLAPTRLGEVRWHAFEDFCHRYDLRDLLRRDAMGELW